MGQSGRHRRSELRCTQFLRRDGYARSRAGDGWSQSRVGAALWEILRTLADSEANKRRVPWFPVAPYDFDHPEPIDTRSNSLPHSSTIQTELPTYLGSCASSLATLPA